MRHRGKKKKNLETFDEKQEPKIHIEDDILEEL